VQDDLKLGNKTLDEDRSLASYNLRNNDTVSLVKVKLSLPGGSGMESRAKSLLNGMPSTGDYLKDLGRKGREAQLDAAAPGKGDYLKDLGRRARQTQLVDEQELPQRRRGAAHGAAEPPKKSDYLKELGTKKTKPKGSEKAAGGRGGGGGGSFMASAAPSRSKLAADGVLGDDTPEALRRRARDSRPKVPWPSHSGVKVNSIASWRDTEGDYNDELPYMDIITIYGHGPSNRILERHRRCPIPTLFNAA